MFEVVSTAFWWTGAAVWASATFCLLAIAYSLAIRVPVALRYCRKFEQDVAAIRNRKPLTLRDRIGLFWFCYTTAPGTMEDMLRRGPIPA